MAWGTLTKIGSGQNKTSSTTVVLTTTVAVNADEVAVIIIAADNTSTVDGDNGEVASIDDSGGGNLWQKAREMTNAQGGADTGATVSMWYSKLVNGIASAGTITATFGTARTAKAITGFKATIGAGNVVSVVVGASDASDGADPPSMDLTPPNAEHLWVRGTALERAAATWTKTAAYELDVGNAGTTGAGAASNMNVNAECDRLTGTTNASDPAATAVDNASVLVAFKEAIPNPHTIFGPVMGGYA